MVVLKPRLELLQGGEFGGGSPDDTFGGGDSPNIVDEVALAKPKKVFFKRYQMCGKILQVYLFLDPHTQAFNSIAKRINLNFFKI